MEYFLNHEHEAAQRYEHYRPKVHTIVLDWLGENVSQRTFARALDVACGTGDSMLPLAEIASVVEGIDLSVSMLEIARAKGLRVRQGAYTDVGECSYDLISTCMAFHWFEPSEAIKAYKRASADTATWLIYNFGLRGAYNNSQLDGWLRNVHYQRFRSPKRGSSEYTPPDDDSELMLVAKGTGSMRVSFSRKGFVGYLTTQTNVEAALGAGMTYEQVERLILSELPTFTEEQGFDYAYAYSIIQFKRG